VRKLSGVEEKLNLWKLESLLLLCDGCM